jgi:hypothetical protein|tara:strand:- start:7152 stop:7364 length:213 start_codon:yes stop_codon:yes gene_type:complete
MPEKKATAVTVAADLRQHEIQCSERWRTAFNEFSDIKEEISSINNTIKMTTFGIFGFIGALAIALISVLL